MYGPLIWTLVMLLTFTIAIIALLLDPPEITSDESLDTCDEYLP